MILQGNQDGYASMTLRGTQKSKVSDTGLTKMCTVIHDEGQEWKRAIGSGDPEKYREYLKKVNLGDSDNLVEAIAFENGFIPEGRGLAALDLERELEIAYRI